MTFFARPFLFLSSLLLTIGEMVKELYQGRRHGYAAWSRGSPAPAHTCCCAG